MTSNSFSDLLTKSNPSPMWSVSFGLSKPLAMNGRNCFDTSTTLASISHWTIFSTVGYFATSLATPPSPPPMIRTDFGLGWQVRGTKVIISWYENSSLSVHWMQPSNTNARPYFFLHCKKSSFNQRWTQYSKNASYLYFQLTCPLQEHLGNQICLGTGLPLLP